ncbi:MAG: universal stress protein [Rhodobacterales bacterium]|nr:universal stress protein [Rhodobacterales bacterium]
MAKTAKSKTDGRTPEEKTGPKTRAKASGKAGDKAVAGPVDSGPPVLVPVDFSRDSEAALLYAADMAACMNAPLAVLHVVHDPEFHPGYYRDAADSPNMPIEDVAQRLLDAFMDRMAADHPEHPALARARRERVSGLPVNRILEVADLLAARAIVMGSRGLTGLPHLLMGSKAERVVQLAAIPVTVVKAPKAAAKARKAAAKARRSETKALRRLSRAMVVDGPMGGAANT